MIRKNAGALALFLTLVTGAACSSDPAVPPGGGGAGGTGGPGGAGGAGGSAACTEGETRACYSGPPSTEAVGMCVAGTETCSDGAWTSCVDEVVPAAEDCNAIGDEDCDGIGCSETLWVLDAGEVYWVNDLAVDGAGNTIVSLQLTKPLTIGAATFTPVDYDNVLVKVSAAGEIQWIKQFGGAGNEGGAFIAIAENDAIVIAGHFGDDVNIGTETLHTNTRDAFVAMIDAAGDHVWSTRFGGEAPDPAGTKWVEGVAVGPSGEIAVVGSNGGHWGGCSPCSLADGEDAFVRIFDSGGNLVHNRENAVAGFQRFTDVSFGADGAIYVTGRFTEGLDLGGGAITTGAAPNRGFVARLDDQGVGVWSIDLDPGGADASRATAVGVLADGTVIVGGFFDSTLTLDVPISGIDDIFVGAFDGDGNPLWSKVLDAGDGGFPELWQLAIDTDDNIIIGGAFTSPLSFDDQMYTGLPGSGNAYLMKLTSAGERLWSRAFVTDVQYSSANRVAVGPAGRISASGIFNGTIDFGTGPVTSTVATHSFYVAGFEP